MTFTKAPHIKQPYVFNDKLFQNPCEPYLLTIFHFIIVLCKGNCSNIDNWHFLRSNRWISTSAITLITNALKIINSKELWCHFRFKVNEGRCQGYSWDNKSIYPETTTNLLSSYFHSTSTLTSVILLK